MKSWAMPPARRPNVAHVYLEAGSELLVCVCLESRIPVTHRDRPDDLVGSNDRDREVAKTAVAFAIDRPACIHALFCRLPTVFVAEPFATVDRVAVVARLAQTPRALVHESAPTRRKDATRIVAMALVNRHRRAVVYQDFSYWATLRYAPGMAIRTELTLRLENSPGALARLCQALADEKVNVIAMNLEGSGVLHLVPDNPVHATGLLRARDYALVEREVLYVQLPNGPGAIGSATRMLGDADVNIEYAYATAINEHQTTALVVAVDDAQRAATAAGM